MADQTDQQVAVIEAVSGLLPRPSASFIMLSQHWRGTHVISRRSAKHEGLTSRILFCGEPRLNRQTKKNLCSHVRVRRRKGTQTDRSYNVFLNPIFQRFPRQFYCQTTYPLKSKETCETSIVEKIQNIVVNKIFVAPTVQRYNAENVKRNLEKRKREKGEERRERIECERGGKGITSSEKQRQSVIRWHCYEPRNWPAEVRSARQSSTRDKRFPAERQITKSPLIYRRN